MKRIFFSDRKITAFLWNINYNSEESFIFATFFKELAKFIKFFRAIKK